MKNKKLLAQIAMVVTTMIWGVTFVVVKDALNDAGPYMFAFLRFGLSFFIGLFYINKLVKETTKFEISAGFICGIALFSGYAFQNFGLIETTPSKSAFITSVSVIMVPVILVLFRIQKVGFRIWGATLLAIIGLYILLDPRGKGLNVGDILTFGCALSFAIHVIFQDRYLSRGINMYRFYLTQIMFTTLFYFLGAMLFEDFSFNVSQRLMVAIIVTGVFGTFISFLLMIWAQTILSANQTAILLSLEPVFAALFSVFFAGEVLGMYGWIGGFIIVLAVISSGISPTKK